MSAKRDDRRGCLIALAVVALLVVGSLLAGVGALTYAVRTRTLPWPERAPVRLATARPHLADADVTPDNAFYYLRQLQQIPEPQAPPAEGGSGALEATGASPLVAEQAAFSEKGYVPGAYPLLDQYLVNAAPSFALCEQAADAPEGQVATVTHGDLPIDYLSPVRGAVRTYTYRIEKQAHDGRWDGVVADTRTALACSRRVADGGPLINHLVAVACNSLVCSSLRRVASRHAVPEEAIASMLALLHEHEGQLQPMAETLRWELLISHGAVDLALGRRGSGGSEDDLLPTPVRLLASLSGAGEAVKRHFSDCLSLLIRDAEAPYSADPPGARELHCFVQDTRTNTPLVVFRGDPVGRILVTLLVPALDKATGKATLDTVTLRGTALVLALHDWRRRQGQPPVRLDELVPQYLPAVPVDPFSGAAKAPFIYRVEGSEWRLYSVGENQCDDGGLNDVSRRRVGRATGAEDACFDSTEFAPEPAPAP